MSQENPQQECPVNCMQNPDAVDKTNWKCNSCGADLKEAHRIKQEQAKKFYAEAKEIEAEAHKLANDAYHKVFSDHLKSKEKMI